MTKQNRNSKAGAASRRKGPAFSLIEVTIALAVVSVTFIALLGLLPVGLNTFTRSVDASVEAQIGQAILTQARQAKFSELDQFPSRGSFNYDEQGKPVTDLDKRIYYAKTTGGGDEQDIKIIFKQNLQVGEDASTGGNSPAGMNIAIVSITVRKVSAPKEKNTIVGYIANNGL